MKQGTIIGATLIAAPSSKKTKPVREGLRCTRLGRSTTGTTAARGFAYGMKDNASVEKDSILIHLVVVTAVNDHDLNPDADLLHGDEKFVYAGAY